ncbi:hypothetical protein C1I92_07470 [Jiangella anatolica]|uniref:Uncharacterized protein n=1 Tax=Jiangella anatolica TaxID=2670374 RepID=A0A2W2C926_9ACTN|nr:hypothetical protein C1I92_07470 [Jiangella anatolica]
MGTRIDRRSLLRAGALLAGSGAVTIAGGATAGAHTEPRTDPAGRGSRTEVSVGLVVGVPTITNDGARIRVAVPILTRGRATTITTQPVSVAAAEVIGARWPKGPWSTSWPPDQRSSSRPAAPGSSTQLA